MGDREDQGSHERVVGTLMDLQSRLRGDEADAGSEVRDPRGENAVEIPEAGKDAARAEDTETVSTQGEFAPEVQILITPDPDATAEREGFAPVTTLPTAVSEDRLSILRDRLARLEETLDAATSHAERLAEEGSARIAALERWLLDEIAAQRAELLSAVEDRFARLEAVLREAFRETVEMVEPDAGGDEPA